MPTGCRRTRPVDRSALPSGRSRPLLPLLPSRPALLLPPLLLTMMTTMPVLALLLPGSARAGDFMDTRITFFFQDDDFLHGAGETLPNSPAAGFGVRQGRVFFYENHNRKDRGDETLTHLVSYKSMPGFIPRLTTEAALVLRFDVQKIYDGNFAAQKGGLRDEGTYINLRYDLDDAGDDNLQLTLFPFSTDRFQLGYSYRMAWGSSRIFGASQKGPAPGLKLSYNAGPSYLFVGAKTASIQRYAPEDQPDINDEIDTFYAGLAGAGYEVTPWLLLELNGGYFERGTNPNNPVRGEPVDAWGASFQAAFHHNLPVQRSADFSLYRNDPDRIPAPRSRAERQPFGFFAAAEVTWLQHVLEDLESYGATRIQDARAGDLNMVLQYGGLTLFTDLVYRDLAFVLFNVPSFVPYQAFGEDLDDEPEMWGAVGADYALTEHFTPGVTVGVQLPATVSAVPAVGSNPPPDASGQRTVVVRGEGDISVLPPNEDATPIFVVKARVRWDLSPMLSLLGEAFFSLDNNRTLLEDDVVGIADRKFVDPKVLGAAVMAQARF